MLQTTNKALPLVLIFASILFTACGGVGEAPRAETGEAVLLAGASGEALAIDPSQSEIKWRAAKVTLAHDGGFEEFSGTVKLHEGEITSIRLEIDTRSIWSDNGRLTNHLKTADFFDVDTFASAVFEAEQLFPNADADATHTVTGNLTMHGLTKRISFPVDLSVENGAVRASADFIIDRTDWEINYTGRADDLIDNNVRLIFNLVATSEYPLAGV